MVGGAAGCALVNAIFAYAALLIGVWIVSDADPYEVEWTDEAFWIVFFVSFAGLLWNFQGDKRRAAKVYGSRD